MEASEIILESEIMKDSTRGEALEKLQDLVKQAGGYMAKLKEGDRCKLRGNDYLDW